MFVCSCFFEIGLKIYLKGRPLYTTEGTTTPCLRNRTGCRCSSGQGFLTVEFGTRGGRACESRDPKKKNKDGYVNGAEERSEEFEEKEDQSGM